MKREWIFAVVVTLFAGLAFADDKATVDVAEAAVWVAQNQFPALDADVFQGKSPKPIEVEFVNQAPANDLLPAQPIPVADIERLHPLWLLIPDNF